MVIGPYQASLYVPTYFSSGSERLRVRGAPLVVRRHHFLSFFFLLVRCGFHDSRPIGLRHTKVRIQNMKKNRLEGRALFRIGEN